MKRTFAFLLLVLIGFTGNTQESMEKLFKQDSLIFYGIDFSMLKAIKGLRAYGDMQKAVDYDFPDMNGKLIAEREKYNFKEWFQLDGVNYDLSYVTELNKKVDPETIIIEPSQFNKITKEQVKEHINSYKLKQTKGTGLVIIYETWQKGQIHEWSQYEDLSYGTFIYVFFDVSNGEVLYAKSFKLPGMGFGNSNFWLRTIYDSGIQLSEDYAIQKKEYDKEQKKKAKEAKKKK